jgi:hypothetical protein
LQHNYTPSPQIPSPFTTTIDPSLSTQQSFVNTMHSPFKQAEGNQYVQKQTDTPPTQTNAMLIQLITPLLHNLQQAGHAIPAELVNIIDAEQLQTNHQSAFQQVQQEINELQQQLSNTEQRAQQLTMDYQQQYQRYA